MEKKNIPSFTLRELIDKYGVSADTLFYDGCVMGHANHEARIAMLGYPIRIDAYVVCLCRTGHGHAFSNSEHCEISRNIMLLHTPENILSLENDDKHNDAELEILAFEPDFLHKLNIDMRQVVPILAGMNRISSIELSDVDMTILESAFSSIRSAVTHFRGMRFGDEIVRRCIESIFYMILEVIHKYIDLREHKAASVKNRNEEYFSRFIKCLHENYKSERSVSFYASQLHITPKYLTTVIRNVSGRSAAAWIDEFVILEAKNLLKYSTMSIQEVAYALNFANQSFFGKYFKHHTQMSPSAYKAGK